MNSQNENSGVIVEQILDDFNKIFNTQNKEISEEQKQISFLKMHLPELLLKGMNAFHTEEEQFLYLYLTLAASSGLLTRVTGEYRRTIVSPNLYCVGIARPASGKGLIRNVQEQFQKVHMHYFKESSVKASQFKEAFNEYNKRKNIDKSIAMPIRPPFKVVFIPANVTCAKLFQHLYDNQQDEIVPQILIDAEIDSLVGSVESDLNNLSSILRKAFHGETISMSRKTENEYYEIYRCQLALALTGTPNQFVKLVNNRSDGLLSRFMVYIIDTPPSIQGIRRCQTSQNIQSTFNELSIEYYQFWSLMQQEDFFVELTDAHLNVLENYLKDRLQRTLEEYGDDAAQIVMRHGLMFLKICMILTSHRKFKNEVSISKMICSEIDINISLILIEKSIQCSLQFFEMLPDDKYCRIDGNKQRLLNNLPAEFTRKLAIEIGFDMKVSEPSIDRWLKQFKNDGRLMQDTRGLYQKL